MKKIVYLCFFIGMGLAFQLQAQQPEKFSKSRPEFISQLEAYMTAGKQKAVEDTYREFENVFSGGMFTEEEAEQILRTSNAMLARGMAANPYFSEYLSALIRVKNSETGAALFQEWHDVLDKMLSDEGNRSLMPFQEFLKFSADFFDNRSLRYSPTGTSWYALTDDFEIDYADGQPYLQFSKLDLMASRKEDSLFIYETAGQFFPVDQFWKGSGGKVTWERFGWDPETYVELTDYNFEMKRSLYEAKNARLHYPEFFGTKIIEGDFSDKLTVENAATGGSYPRFESYEDDLELNNIGPGINHIGGIRIQGTSIYGFGTKDNKAKIRIYDDHENLLFRAASEQFRIRPDKGIVGQNIETTFYFGQDSIYHPSVNVRFAIPKKELELSRGDRGSDRNPFYSSVHRVNIDVDKIDAYLDRDSVIIGRQPIHTTRKDDIYFESFKYFNRSDYRRFQNIATSNPIAIMKVTAEREGNNFIDANLLASRINSKFTVDNIQSLLYDLASQGFINYDSDKQIVEVKDKVFHYADADQDKVDYDELRIRSSTDSMNAVLNLRDSSISISGVKNIEFSARQKVAILPEDRRVTLKPKLNMEFGGTLFAGFGILEGKGFHFDYDKYRIGLDSIRYFDLFIPTGELDGSGNPVAYSMNSRIEYLTGVLLIDAPNNKSGREDIPMFPSLQSKAESYVFYDHKETQDSIYSRDSFYFELDPFSFNHLDAFTPKDIRFDGKLVSAEIFPDIEETLFLQEDNSLGFATETSEDGLPSYQGKGNYTGKITLSNGGLLGDGTLEYLWASVNSEDLVFKPRQVLASANEFNVEEDRESEPQVPQVSGEDVEIDWRPYKDSMYVSPKLAPFALFKEENHTLDGTMILSPGGLKGTGLLDWDKASMRSDYFSFGAFSAEADTSDVNIRAFETEELALKTENVYSFVDFDKQIGTFRANEALLNTVLPYNQYQTSMNEFDWDMKNETINFKTEEGGLGEFLSIHPDQDSLRFQGENAFYDLRSNELKIGGIPFIIAADAFIYPDSGKVDIQQGGVMTTLENARIVADTINQYHVINRATVDIRGRKEYRASGFYEYNIGDREQEIEFADVAGTRVGKGSMSEKRVATRAKGEVTEEDHFYIDHKTEFQGTISLESESSNLYFEGFARLDAEKLPETHWFTVSSEGDKKDLAIRYDSPKNYDGVPLETGLFLSRETAQIYPRIMMPLYFRKDRPILPVTGIFKYDENKDEFIFGDSSRVLNNELLGNKLVFNNATGAIQAEGKMNIGSGLKYVTVDAAGRLSTAFPPSSNVMTDQDTSLFVPTVMPVETEMMAAIKMMVPEKLLKMMTNDIISSSFDAKNVDYTTKQDHFKKMALEIFPDEPEVVEGVEAIGSGFLDIPKKFNPYSFVFSTLPMKWDPDYQSFVVTEPEKVGINSINGEPIHKMLDCYVEFKMPTNEDDRLYIYLKSPSELYYFFGFKQGILSITSNNPNFMDELLGLKSKDLILKMDDGETFEIQPVEPSTAKLFLRRMQAVGKQ